MLVKIGAGETKMGAAFAQALANCKTSGGRTSHRIITNIVRNGGTIGEPAKRRQQGKESSAVSAVMA